MTRKQDIPLYHWSPTSRRKSIIRRGLVPASKPTVTALDEDWRPPYICFAESPSWAWALSGGMGWAPTGDWDLWQTTINSLVKPRILPSYDNHRWHEVRTYSRVYKSRLWYVGSRTKE